MMCSKTTVAGWAAVLLMLLPVLALAQEQPKFDLVPYRKGNKWGLCTAAKTVVVKPQYDGMFYKATPPTGGGGPELKALWFGGLVAVEEAGRWGVLSATGELIVPTEYDAIRFVENKELNGPPRFFVKATIAATNESHLYTAAGKRLNPEGHIVWGLGYGNQLIVKKGEDFGVMNADESIAIPCAAYQGISMQNGYYIASSRVGEYGRKDKLFALDGSPMPIDDTGRISTTGSRHCNYGLVSVSLNGHKDWYRIQEGNVEALQNVEIPRSKSGYMDLMKIQKGGKWGLIGCDGEDILPVAFSSLEVRNLPGEIVADNALYNTNGELLLQADAIRWAAENHFLYKQGRLWGLAHSTGQTVLAPCALQPTDIKFRGLGCVAVRMGDRLRLWHLSQQRWTLDVEAPVRWEINEHRGQILLTANYKVVDKGWDTKLYNAFGLQLLPEGFPLGHIWPSWIGFAGYSKGVAVVHNDKFKVLAPAEYKDVKAVELENGELVALVQDRATRNWGAFGMDGTQLLPCEYKTLDGGNNLFGKHAPSGAMHRYDVGPGKLYNYAGFISTVLPDWESGASYWLLATEEGQAEVRNAANNVVWTGPKPDYLRGIAGGFSLVYSNPDGTKRIQLMDASGKARAAGFDTKMGMICKAGDRQYYINRKGELQGAIAADGTVLLKQVYSDVYWHEKRQLFRITKDHLVGWATSSGEVVCKPVFAGVLFTRLPNAPERTEIGLFRGLINGQNAFMSHDGVQYWD